MKYEVIIGLEVHVQLLTKSKMFCSCSADYASAPPNTYVCPICLGMPGVLPVINKQAVKYTIMTALALNCSIPPSTKFDRKNYPYPDLMKGYQISQYDAPIGRDGWLIIDMDGVEKRVSIQRVHLEEDTAKLVHRSSGWGESYSLVDVNRSGVPLMEVVGQPDIRSAEEARQYLVKLRTILQYLGVSTGNMEEGSFRCDANISLRPQGTSELLPKAEIKNMNSFRAVYRALSYEAERQGRVLDEGGKLIQETRGWVEERGVSVQQRVKEYTHDYRYFPEPDLPPMAFSPSWVEELKARLPELPDARRQRFMVQMELSEYDARLLVSSKALADYYETCVRLRGQPKAVANWLLGDFSRLLNVNSSEIQDSKVKPEQLVELLTLIDQGRLSGPAAKTVFENMFASGRGAGGVMAEMGLEQITAASEVEGVVVEVLKAHPQAVADYKAGKKQALTFLTGQVMRQSRGRANPKLVNQILEEQLSS